MNYLIVLFINKDYNNPCVIGFDLSRTSAESKAQDHLRTHPEDAVHIYDWVTGYEASTRVEFDRQWNYPMLPPTVIEPVHPAVIDALAGESDGSQNSTPA